MMSDFQCLEQTMFQENYFNVILLVDLALSKMVGAQKKVVPRVNG